MSNKQNDELVDLQMDSEEEIFLEQLGRDEEEQENLMRAKDAVLEAINHEVRFEYV